MKQKEPSGQIKFATYEKYREFCLFIQHKPLVMEYITPAGNFLMDVSIDKLEKASLKQVDYSAILNCLDYPHFIKSFVLK